MHTQSYSAHTELRLVQKPPRIPYRPVLTDNTHFFNLLFEPSAPIGKGSYHSSATATLSLTRSTQMELGTEKKIGQREQREKMLCHTDGDYFHIQYKQDCLRA